MEEPVHVAEALHRAAEAEDEPGGARDEALPAERAGSPVRKVKVIFVCAMASVHGATLHWFLASSATPFNGTLTPSSGIANVWEASSGFISVNGFPSTAGSPTSPCGLPQNGLRRPVAVSNW